MLSYLKQNRPNIRKLKLLFNVFFCFGPFSFVLESTPLKNFMGKKPEKQIEDEVDYDHLPDLNPITSAVRSVATRALKEVDERGIPVILAYNGIKALVVAGVAFAISPGELEEKAYAARIAGAALLGASPTFYAAGVMAVAKTSVRAWKSITSPKP